MAEKRDNQRVACANKCHLSFDGKKYRAIIQNLSHSGALLRITARNRPELSQGGRCSLIISDDPQFIAGEFNGNIVHSHSTKIGIQFQF